MVDATRMTTLETEIRPNFVALFCWYPHARQKKAAAETAQKPEKSASSLVPTTHARPTRTKATERMTATREKTN